MSPMNAGKMRAALDKNLGWHGGVAKRSAIIEELVGKGAKVVTSQGGERRLTSPDGSYLTGDTLTKTGLDYAEWLAGKH